MRVGIRRLIAFLIMVLVTVNFYLSLKKQNAASQKERGIEQILIETEETINAAYPEDPEEIIAMNNTLFNWLYKGETTQEQVEQIITLQRELYESSFLDLTPQMVQLEKVLKERFELEEKSIKVLSSKVMNAYEEPPGIMKVEVIHYTNQKDITRLYMLRRETQEGPQKDRWKIYGWKDIE